MSNTRRRVTSPVYTLIVERNCDSCGTRYTHAIPLHLIDESADSCHDYSCGYAHLNEMPAAVIAARAIGCPSCAAERVRYLSECAAWRRAESGYAQ
jgi:hypothetical protein